MPRFDHRDTGTAEDRWRQSPLLLSAAAADLAGVTRVIVIAAHPDDETLGAGGTIALLGGRGVPVDVVVATLGERSHPESSTHDPARLAELRTQETRCAVTALHAAATLQLLGLPDGALAAYTDELADRIRPLLAADSYGVDHDGILLLAPWPGDGHPDHHAAGSVARELARDHGVRVLEYPIWAWHWADPGADDLPAPDLRTVQLDPAARGAKRKALGCYTSQHTALSELPGDEPILAPDFLSHFDRDREVFVMSAPESLQVGYFDRMYQRSDDPWSFRTRWYEERKRSLTLAALPRRRFRSAFEPGCSIGLLTAELATRCDALLATDIAAAAVESARARVADRPGTTVALMQTPAQWPGGSFDLVVLSEIAYYCAEDDLQVLAVRAAGSLTADGVLVACHWRHPVEHYPTSGDRVHEVLTGATGLVTLAHYEDEDFLLDVLVRPPAISVGRAEGLVG